MTFPLSVPAAIEARHSVRSYTSEPVTDAELHEILRLTGLAPSAWNLQPWRFVAVRDQATKDTIQKAAYNQPQVGSCPVLLVVYNDLEASLKDLENIAHPGMSAEQKAGFVGQVQWFFGNLSPDARANWGAGQTYIGIGFLLLAAQSLGFATSPMLGFDPAAVKKILGLPDHVTVPALVALGRPAQDGFPAHRYPVEQILKVV
jgi:nitroreductase